MTPDEARVALGALIGRTAMGKPYERVVEEVPDCTLFVVHLLGYYQFATQPHGMQLSISPRHATDCLRAAADVLESPEAVALLAIACVPPDPAKVQDVAQKLAARVGPRRRARRSDA